MLECWLSHGNKNLCPRDHHPLKHQQAQLPLWSPRRTSEVLGNLLQGVVDEKMLEEEEDANMRVVMVLWQMRVMVVVVVEEEVLTQWAEDAVLHLTTSLAHTWGAMMRILAAMCVEDTVTGISVTHCGGAPSHVHRAAGAARVRAPCRRAFRRPIGQSRAIPGTTSPSSARPPWNRGTRSIERAT